MRTTMRFLYIVLFNSRVSNVHLSLLQSWSRASYDRKWNDDEGMVSESSRVNRRSFKSMQICTTISKLWFVIAPTQSTPLRSAEIHDSDNNNNSKRAPINPALTLIHRKRYLISRDWWQLPRDETTKND